ncbi:Protein CBG16069 [Caenorhabditis briggsae]|uniref:Uncharacterized protein n=2 Tax=Caenorhabditis briggsae TaxID=6238 RepID=A0AAE9CSV4_CAEBR|nr:Protein CBG16069 [Caenorhabditis briggsae]ULT80136.1 hypothetical protein L3Y34_010605 [Caenorhabditis briggsae]UMM39423.1 hypothetical protein L5515_016493 [Caenorhabditis briggsae]CAP34291.1 Protein CBG16069 [Caenorhabditis briggsae]
MDVNQVLDAPQQMHSLPNALGVINEQLLQNQLTPAAPSTLVPKATPILEMFRGINPLEHGLFSIPTALPGPRGSLTLGTSQLMINLELSRMQEQVLSNMKASGTVPAPVSHSSSAESSSSNNDSAGLLTLGSAPWNESSNLDQNFLKALLASTTLCSSTGITSHVAMSDCTSKTLAQQIEEQYKKRMEEEQKSEQSRKRARENSVSVVVNAKCQDVGSRTELASSDVPSPKLQNQGDTDNEIQVIAHHRPPPNPVLAIPTSTAPPASTVLPTSSAIPTSLNLQASSRIAVSTNAQGTSWQQKVSQSMQQLGLLEQKAIIIAAAAQPKPQAPQSRAPQSQVFVMTGAQTESSYQQCFSAEMFDCGYMNEAEIVTEDHIPQNIAQKLHTVMNETLATPGIFGSHQKVYMTIMSTGFEIKIRRTTTKVEFGKLVVVYLHGAADVLGIGFYHNNSKERMKFTILKMNSTEEKKGIAVALLRCCARKYVGNPTDFETFFF